MPRFIRTDTPQHAFALEARQSALYRPVSPFEHIA